MIRISASQAVAFAGSVDHVGYCAIWLAENFAEPYCDLDVGTLRGMAGHGLRRAEALGVRTFQGQLTFLGLMAAVAPDFDRSPMIRSAIASEAASHLESLPDRVDPMVWEQIGALGSGLGWWLERPQWDDTREARVSIATAAATAGIARLPAAEAVKAATTWEPTRDDEDALFVASVLHALLADGRARNVLSGTLDRTGSNRAAVASIRLRLFLQHRVWC